MADIDPVRDGLPAEEAAYIDRLKRREPDAWSALFDAYHERIRRLAWAELRSSHDAEDVAATVFLRALNGIDAYSYRGRPIVAWLYKIARNIIKERRRKAARERLARGLGEDADGGEEGDGAGPSSDADDVIRRLDLLDAMSQLTRDQQEVLSLTYLAGFSVREVARMLGKGERAVYYVQARGLVRLKEELG